MNVERQEVHSHNTSCSFCNRGILSRTGTSLTYPYNFVFTIEREKGGVRASMCVDCVIEFAEKVETIINNKP